MSSIGVIGNVSIDTARYPGGQAFQLLGGAALYIALAARDAGLTASPITVVGDELGHLHTDPRLDGLDLCRVLTAPGPNCRFDLSYDSTGQLTAVTGAYGVAEALSWHAAAVLAGWDFDHWHVACRRPLDSARILGALAAAGALFSVDFHLASAPDQIRAVADLLTSATAIFVNTAERDILTRHIHLGALPALIVSDGPRAAVLYRHGEPAATATPPAITAREVTGAGDTLAGTFIAVSSQGADDHTCLTAAVAAASRRASEVGLRHRPRT